MSVNLLDLVKGQLTDDVVGKAASFLGESTEATQSGLTSAVPALLGGVMNKVGSTSGAADLLGMVTKPEVTGILGNVGELFGGSSDSNLGSSLLQGILGDKLGSISSLIGSVAGFKNEGSASGLLKMAAPLLMGVIGKQVGSSGVSGLMNLISGQKEHLEKAVPAGLMDKVAGALGVGSFGSLAGNVASNFASSGSISGSGSGSAKTSSSSAHSGSSEPKKGGNKILPLLGLLAVLAIGFFLWKSCGDDVKNATKDAKEGMVNTAKGTVEQVKKGAKAVGDGAAAVGNAVVESADAIYGAGADLVGKTVKGFEHLGKFVGRKLKDGTELVVPEKGFEYKLVEFIESDKPADKETWFDLRRVLFKTGSADLDERSMSQIENVAKILKAYPAVALKIGGYTDNTGNAAANKALSAKRAKAVVDALVAKGIDKTRLASEGYGVEHPIADNNTEEGRALNRRVAARVSKK